MSIDNPNPLPIFKGGAIRNWLRTSGSGIFKAFEVGTDALKYIRANLGGIRTQDFYEIRRQVEGLAAVAKKIKDYPGDQLVPLRWHDADHGLTLSSEFQYRVEIIGVDTKTGLLKSQFMTVASKTQLTTDQIQDTARSYIGEGGESGDIVVGRFGEITPMRR